MNLLPQPQKIEVRGGFFVLPPDVSIGISDTSFLPAAREIKAHVNKVQGKSLSKKRQEIAIPIHILHPAVPDTFYLSLAPELSAEEYRITIDWVGVRLEAGSSKGAFQGAQTLRQILLQANPIPHLQIHDWPDLQERGLYYDVCRGRVPKLERLFELAELLSHYKINQLQLYIEHTFAFRGHPEIGKEASPLSADDILSLDAHCRSRHIELIPSLASFGHLSKILKNKAYNELAEDWGRGKYVSPDAQDDFSHTGWSLSPANPDIYPFLDSLYAEFLPLFTSQRFNACCDETFDLGWGQSYELCKKLGKGRVYLEHIKKINDLSKKYGKSLMIWGDIIRQYPELVSEIPKDVTVLDWAYGYDHAFDSLRDFEAARLNFIACPGTSSWLGLFPRIPQACSNIAGFARAAKNYNAAGLLNTDWGDGGHYNFMENSWHGYLFGAELAWNVEAEQSSFTKRFVEVFFGRRDDELASALEELGEISFTCPAGGGACVWQDLFFALPDDPIFATLQSDRGSFISEGKIVTDQNRLDARSLQRILDRLDAIRSVFTSRSQNDDPKGVLSYWIYAVDATALSVRKLLEYGVDSERDDASRRAITADMRRLRRRFQKLWLDRNRTSELRITLARFDRAIRGDSLRTQLEENERGNLCFTIVNNGKRKASGTATLASFPEGAMQFEHLPELHFTNLPPGESQSAEFSFQVAPGVEKIVVKSASTDTNVSKCVLGVFKKKFLDIPRFNNLPEIGLELAHLLIEKGTRCQITIDGASVGEACLAMGSHSLCLLVTARDQQITRGQPIWKGSGFEIFAKCADAEIAQIFLCPSTVDAPAAAFELDRSAKAIVPAPLIAIQELERGTENYKIVAAIPLSILHIDQNCSNFRMEIVLTSVTSPEHGYQRTPLFHPVEDPSTNCRGFGFIKILPRRNE